MFQLMDNYSATYSVLILGVIECLVISYVYGEYIMHMSMLISMVSFNVYVYDKT